MPLSHPEFVIYAVGTRDGARNKENARMDQEAKPVLANRDCRSLGGGATSFRIETEGRSFFITVPSKLRPSISDEIRAFANVKFLSLAWLGYC